MCPSIGFQRSEAVHGEPVFGVRFKYVSIRVSQQIAKRKREGDHQ